MEHSTATTSPTLPDLLGRLRARWPRRARARRVVDARPAVAPFGLPGLSGAVVSPGLVLGVDEVGRPLVRLQDGLATELTAEWALPYRYVAAPGDLLWLISRGSRAWALGVAHGRGRSELAFRGDATLRAGGTLRLQADRGLRLVGKVVTLRARALEVLAQALEEKLGWASRLVKGALDEVAGSALRVTEGEECLTAGSVTVLAEEVARLDGDVVQVS